MPVLHEIFSHLVYIDPADHSQGHADVLLPSDAKPTAEKSVKLGTESEWAARDMALAIDKAVAKDAGFDLVPEQLAAKSVQSFTEILPSLTPEQEAEESAAYLKSILDGTNAK